MAHAGAEYWNSYFKHLQDNDDDLDWEYQWVGAFLKPLREAGTNTLLELGCGTGNDAARIARLGYRVTAIDFSIEAVKRAADSFGSAVTFLLADMATNLPFQDGSFDAIMSNVALHMFTDAVTRSIFTELRRVTLPGGLLLFHVNADQDRSLREGRRAVACELEPGYVLEESGQAVRFFTRAYLEDLLEPWTKSEVTLVEILDPGTGEPFKRVWRGIAYR